jgi:hypothetical protein
MRTTTLWCSVALGGLMIGTTGTAAAADHGFYMSVDGGLAAYPDELNAPGPSTSLKQTESDSSDFAWSFAAGYRFNRYLALELGFADLGEAATAFEDEAGPASGRANVRFSARGKTLALLAHAPRGNWDPYFKIGVMQTVIDQDVFLMIPEFAHASRFESREEQLLLGLGVRYAFSDQWALSAAVDFHARLGERTYSGRGNVTSPRIGFAYRF